MSLVVATRVADGLRLEIDASSSLIIGNEATAQVQYREALFAYLLVSAAPAVLKHSTIEEQVLKPFGIGLPPSDPMQYIRKLKLSADRRFKAATGKSDLIASIRGMGYRLAGEWKLQFPRSKGRFDSAVEKLQMLAIKCVELMRETPLTSVEGNLVLDIDHANNVDLTMQFRICIQELFHSANIEKNYTPSDADEQILGDIFSYFSFSRQGNVEEKVWRHLFERELFYKVHVLLERLYGTS